MTVHLLDPICSTQRTALRWRTYAPSEVDAALAAWRRLEQRLGDSSCACSAAWTQCWINAYGDLIPYHILAAEAGGEVRGICLIAEGVGQRVGPFALPTRHLGTAGEPQPGSVCVEYNRLLVEPAFLPDFVQGVWKHLAVDRRWLQLRLDGFSETDLAPWLAHFPGAEIRRRDSKFFDLRKARDAGTDVLAQLGKSTRSNLKRRLKQYGELHCEWAESADAAEDILHELIQLHQARWQAVGQPGAFASERFLRFQRECALQLFLEGRSVLFRVRHQGETVGCLYLLIDQNRLLDYLSGFADFEVKPSPGLTTHLLCMTHALARGYDAYDFLVGDKRHKDNLSTDVAQLCWLTWSRPSWKFAAVSALRTVKQIYSAAHLKCAAKPESAAHGQRAEKPENVAN
jgi:CelD/BcsL family acetyltransferase involved in cellulose biosynthesis